MKILILGASGMAGSAFFKSLTKNLNLNVFGTLRNIDNAVYFNNINKENFIKINNINDIPKLTQIINKYNFQLIINCVGLTKQKINESFIIDSIKINSLFPHELARICTEKKIRLIHLSTDCVFSGYKGNYAENSLADPIDIYGRSKLLGEISDNKYVLTIRTSIIGHELSTRFSLLEWFLNQKENCKGFNKAIFSGFPTGALAKVIEDYIIPNSSLYGTYHIASNPINKYDLLCLIAKIYKKSIKINLDPNLIVDRSLDAKKFNKKVGFIPPSWDDLIEDMYSQHLEVN